MTVADNELSSVRGAAKSFVFRVFDEDEDPFPLTGHSAVFEIKKNADSPTATLLKTSASASEIEFFADQVADAGRLRVFVDSDDLKAEAAGDYKYGLWIDLATGERHAVLHDELYTLEPRVRTIA